MDKKKILVVDDEAMMRQSIRYALSEDYQIAMVESGTSALMMLDEEVPDLIVMEMKLPEMDGREVVRRIKGRAEWSDIPILFMTGDHDPNMETECLELGADDFVTKPFADAVIQTRIRRILELRELQRNLELQLENKKRQAEIVTQQSVQDKLTGLYNREYLKENFTELAQRAECGTFFLIDMNRFKEINDNFGDIAGDKVLQVFGGLLLEAAGDTSSVCRISGDEFVIYVPGMTGREEAGKLAETITDKLNSCGDIREYLPKLSLSIGIAFYPEDGRSLETIYQNANKALYYVKNNRKEAYHFYRDEEAEQQYDVSADLDNICNVIETKMDSRTGALTVVYGEFQQLYNFVARYVERRHQEVQAVLVTLAEGEQGSGDAPFMTRAMEVLEEAVNSSLRSCDVATRYSDRQYLIILMDSDLTNGRMVTKRVIDQFRDRYSDEEVKVYFDVRTVGG